MTLVELAVAMTVSMILILMMVGIITADSKAQTFTSNSASAASNVRLVLLALQNDIQAANPIATLSSTSAYQDELQLTVQPTGTVVTWLYSPTTQKLTRQTGAAGAVTELANVTNGDPSSGGTPVFSYFDHCSINLGTEAQATPAGISSATTAVQITLSVASANAAQYESTTTVNLMNSPPGSSLCG